MLDDLSDYSRSVVMKMIGARPAIEFFDGETTIVCLFCSKDIADIDAAMVNDRSIFCSSQCYDQWLKPPLVQPTTVKPAVKECDKCGSWVPFKEE